MSHNLSHLMTTVFRTKIAGPRLVISDVSESFDFEANSHSFFVNSNLTWSWSSDVAWITSDEDTPQTGSQTFSYSVTENISTERTGTITFTAGDITRTHTVTQGPYPILTIDDAAHTFDSDADSLTFNVTSNTDWTWFASEDWVTSTEAVFQNGNQAFTYSVTANTGAERTATITFVDVQAGVVVAQHSITQQTEPLISLSQETFEVESGETTNSVNVTSNTDWTWSSDSAWVTSVESSPQNGNQEFTFTVAANATGVERVGTITFTAGDKTASITITQEAVIPLLLDTYTGTVGFSLRKIRTDYTGPAVRIRRESDSAEQDIAFVAGELDTDTIETFCAGTVGRVTTWYDQVGSNNAVQTDTTLQPIIYESGAIPVNEYGRPAIRCLDNNPSGSTGRVTLPAFFTVDQPYVAYSSVYSLLDSGNFPPIVASAPFERGLTVAHDGTTRIPRTIAYRTSGSKIAGSGGTPVDLNTTTIRFDYADRTLVQIFLNTDIEDSGSAGADADVDFTALNPISLGGRNATIVLNDTLLSEVIGFTVNQTANNLAIRTDQFNYWTSGITPTTLSISDSTQSFSDVSGTHSFNVTADATWSWSCDADWITSNEFVNQTGNKEFTYSVSTNEGEERTATITFTSGGLTATHTVTQSAPAPLLLDTYTGAVGFSLRKIRTAYTGDCIRVRRASDDAEQDIGFSGNDLDTAAIETFCSGTTGHVTTWYDQVGSNDAVKAVFATTGPVIYESGAVVVNEHGLPAIRFFDDDSGAVETCLRCSAWAVADAAWLAQSMVYSLKSLGSSPTIFYGTPLRSDHFNDTGRLRIIVQRTGGSVGSQTAAGLSVDTTTIRMDSADRTNVQIFLDTESSAELSIADRDEDASIGVSDIGNRALGAILSDTLMSELIGFTADESANNLAIRTDQYNYWKGGSTPPPDTLSIDDETQSFDAASGSHSFNVTSNTTWSWESNSAWLTSAEGASQTGNQEFSYTVTENESTERTGVITFTAGDLTVTHMVTQAAPIAPPSPILVLNDAEESFTFEPGSHTISVTANGDWSWEADAAWVTSGEAVTQNGNQDFTYSVTENLTGTERTAHITFTSGLLTASHMIVQSATIAPPPEMEDFTEFDYVADMLASTDPAKGTGEIWYAQGYRYVELDPAATNQHLTTAAGVKLRALQDGSGAVTTEQLGWLPEVAQESAFNDHLPKLDPVSVLTVTDFYNCDGGRASLSQPSMNIFGAYRRYSGFRYGTQGGNARIRFRDGGGSARRIKYSCDQSPTASSGFSVETPRFVYEDMQGEQKALVNCGFTRADKSHIENCEFWDAHLQMYMLGGFGNRISDCYFTADWGPERLFGEGIKTTTAENGTPSMKMYSNYYDRCKRDGIDLTGGGKGMRICNNVFHLNGIGRDPTHTGIPTQGIDLKTPSNGVTDPTSRLPTEFIDICDNIFWGAATKITQTLLDQQTAEIYHVYGMKGLMHSRNTYEFKEYGGNIRGGGPPVSDLINLNNERLYRVGIKPWFRGSARNIVQTASSEPNRSPLFKLGSPKWVDFANLISLVPTNNLVDPGPGLGGPKITGHSTKFALANTLWTRLHQLDNYIHLTVSMSVYGPGGIALAWSQGATPETSGGRGIVVAGCFGKNVNSVLSYSTGANGLIDDCSVVGNIIKGTTLVNDPRFLTAPNREGLVIIQNTSNGIPARVGDANIDPVIEQNVGVT